ncbi:MAG: alpha-2-macroglobulin, partial [Polaromonas sp.]|nr:alpha-2-macroglobulin [Polaromonas sp.]
MAAVALNAQALQLVGVSPQGEVAQIRQVVAKFDAAAVNFGDPKAPAPLRLSCSDPVAAKGTGRWTSEREWVFDFDNDLPPGLRCSVQAAPGFKDAKGQPLSGRSAYQFNTGGPFVQEISPDSSDDIDEEQYFILQLNGPATLASVQKNVWCVVEGLGERVPVRLIDGPERAALLKAHNLDKDAAKEPLKYATLSCNRRLTPATKIQIVYGKGVSTPGGVPNSVEKRFDFKVRAPFAASFSCERENAQAGCLPMRPMTMSFNAPVTRKLAGEIRLNSDKEALKPEFDGGGDGDSTVNSLSFKPTMTERASFQLTLPKDFKDASGRTLRNAEKFPLKVTTGAMPPLAKFAAAPFGIVERFAEPNGVALLPVTLRNVEAALQIKGLNPATAGKVSDLQPQTDAEIIAWFRKVSRYDSDNIARSIAAADIKGPLPAA